VIPARQQVGPNDFDAQDIEDDNWSAPFANFGYDFIEYGSRYWFNYFATEARHQIARKNPNWKREYMAAINLVFLKQQPIPQGKRDITGRGWWPALRPGIDHWKTAAAPGQTDSNTIWREAMSKLLKLGFRAVSKGDVPPPGVQVLELDATRAPHHMLQQRVMGRKLAELEKIVDPALVPVYWRSETRDLKRILSQGGTRRQCDVESIAKDMNMTAPWHPFSDPSLSKYMWFRLANTDNDYYTVISVATNFETACCFPKINEKRVYQFPPAQVANWSKGQADRFKSNLGLVLENGRETVRVITATTTYMLIHTGSILDTMGANKTNKNDTIFPEIGVDYIPLDNIYCVLPIQRVHDGMGEKDSFTVFVDSSKCERLHLGKEIDVFGMKLSGRLFDMFFEKKFCAPFSTAWTGTGGVKPAVPAVTRIIEFPISQGKFQTFRATLADNETVGAFATPKSVGENMKAVLAKLPLKV
jgi:hypothetical protein